MPEKAKNKRNLQQRVSLRITLPKIILLQSDTKAQVMFAATQNGNTKNARKQPKAKKLAKVNFTTYFTFINGDLTKRH